MIACPSCGFKIKPRRHKCLRCEARFRALAPPARCPQCDSRYWKIPRGKLKRGRPPKAKAAKAEPGRWVQNPSRRPVLALHLGPERK